MTDCGRLTSFEKTVVFQQMIRTEFFTAKNAEDPAIAVLGVFLKLCCNSLFFVLTSELSFDNYLLVESTKANHIVKGVILERTGSKIHNVFLVSNLITAVSFNCKNTNPIIRNQSKDHAVFGKFYQFQLASEHQKKNGKSLQFGTRHCNIVCVQPCGWPVVFAVISELDKNRPCCID